MEKLKTLFKNKKLILSIIGIILLTEIIVFVFIIGLNKNNSNKNKPSLKQNLIEETYVMFVKINPLVKLTFKESYYECEKEDGKTEICSSRNDEVISYELLNEDAKKTYKEIDFTGKSVFNSLAILCDKARDNDIELKSIQLTSDWKNIPDKSEIKKQLTEDSKYSVDYDIVVDFKESVDAQEILNKELLSNPEIKTYMVKFETDGGNRITGKVVEENTPVEEPNEPTKNGYTFVEWQLNGKKFNFDQAITKDITLTAKWKKEETKTDNSSNSNTQNNNKNDNQNTTQKPNNSNNEVKPTEQKVLYPDFLKEGYTLEKVEEFVDKNNIFLSYSEEETDEYAPGTVFYQSKKAGSTVISGTTLKVTVAKASKSDNKEEIITKSFIINEIVMKNISNDYTVDLLEEFSTTINLTGKESLLNSITNDSFQLFVNLENISVGEQTLKINVFGLDSNINYTLSPDEVRLNIKNKNGNNEETNSNEPGQDDTTSYEE